MQSGTEARHQMRRKWASSTGVNEGERNRQQALIDTESHEAGEQQADKQRAQANINSCPPLAWEEFVHRDEKNGEGEQRVQQVEHASDLLFL